MKSVPTTGDMVMYYPTGDEMSQMGNDGNQASALPAVVVAAWGETTLNLKVFTDGNGQDLWKTSVPKANKGDKTPGYWGHLWDDHQ